MNLFMQNLPQFSISERLKHAEHLAKDKDKAVIWIENLIVIMRENLISASTNKTNNTLSTHDTLDTLKKLQSLHTVLKTTNVNPRFAIEHTLLSL
jgi:hypothetical protein